MVCAWGTKRWSKKECAMRKKLKRGIAKKGGCQGGVRGRRKDMKIET